LESPWTLLQKSEKNVKVKKIQIFIAKSSYVQEKIAQNAKTYTFLKSPAPSQFKCTKRLFAKFLKPKCVLKKLKMCKLPLKASVQKSVQNFFAKIVTRLEVSLNIDLVWYG